MSLIKQLIRHEGMRLKPYRDQVGKLTIGVGRNLDDMGISESEAIIMLNNDVLRCDRETEKFLSIPEDMDDIRLNVLVNMCFNLGIKRLQSFKKMLAAVRIKDYETAAKEMLDSHWAWQVKGRATE